MDFKIKKGISLILIFLILISTTVFVFGENAINSEKEVNVLKTEERSELKTIREAAGMLEQIKIPAEEMVSITFYAGNHGTLAYVDGSGHLVSGQDEVVVTVKKGTPFKQVNIPFAIPDAGYTFNKWNPDLPDEMNPVMYDLEFNANYKIGFGTVHDHIKLSMKNGEEMIPIAGANIHIVGKVLPDDVAFLLVGDEITDENGIADYTHTYRYTIKYTITLPETIEGNYVIDSFLEDESYFKEKHSIFDIYFGYVFTDANVTDIKFEDNKFEFIVHDAPLAWGQFKANLVFSGKPKSNFFITGDDTYDVYINGVHEYSGLETSFEHASNYTTVNEYYYDDGFNHSTLVAIKGADTSGRANVASINAMYKVGDDYKVTNDRWFCYVGDTDSYTDNFGKVHQWYEEGYKSNDWEPVTVIDPIPAGVHWNTVDWPYSNNKNYFIWSENYKYINDDPRVRETLIDSPVLFRNIKPASYGTLHIVKDWVGTVPDESVIVLIKCGDTVIDKVKLDQQNDYRADIDLPRDLDCIMTVEEEFIEGYKTEYWINGKESNEIIFDDNHECTVSIVNSEIEYVDYDILLEKHWVYPNWKVKKEFVNPLFIGIKSVEVGIFNSKEELVKKVQLMPSNEEEVPYGLWSKKVTLSIPSDEKITDYYVEELTDLSDMDYKVIYPKGQGLYFFDRKLKGLIFNELDAGILRISKQFNDSPFMRSVTVDIFEINPKSMIINPKPKKILTQQIQINGDTGYGYADVRLLYNHNYKIVEQSISGYKVSYSGGFGRDSNEIKLMKMLPFRPHIRILNSKIPEEKVQVLFDVGENGTTDMTTSFEVAPNQKLEDVINNIPIVNANPGWIFDGWDPVYDGSKTPNDYQQLDNQVLKFNATYIEANFFISGDDRYIVYINGNLEYNSPQDESSYSNLNSYVYDDGFDNNTLVAIEGLDVGNVIAGDKAMYKLENGEYLGTDSSWWIYVGQMEEGNYTEPPMQGNLHWYDREYKLVDGWVNATEIENEHPDWNSSWPFEGYKWIWSDRFMNIQEYRIAGTGLDKKVYMRSMLNTTLKYNKNAADATGTMADETKVIGSSFNLTLNKFVRPGYTFNGWRLEDDVIGGVYNNGANFTMPAYDVELYAQWKKISTGGSGGGTVVLEPEEVPLGELNKVDHFAYLQGYPDKTIRPNGNVTRAEVSAIFYRLLENEYRSSVRSYNNVFNDVYMNSWYNKHVSSLSKGRILLGYQDGTFKPDKYITRAELAAIASRFDKLELNVENPFSDTKGHWAEKYISSAAKKGWIEGYANGTFMPDKNITRAELVKFINNVLGRHVHKEDILPGTVQFKDLNDDQLWFYSPIKAATNSYLYDVLEDQFQKWTKLIKPIIEM